MIPAPLHPGQNLLALPPIGQGSDDDVSLTYGADKVAAAYCGFAAPPAPLFGIWNHSWAAAYRMGHPDEVAANFTGARAEQTYWVARREQEAYLKAQGFPHTRAIGLPLVYLPPVSVPREAGSLLVMPPHIAPYVTAGWDCRAYVEAIDAVRGDFSKVVICVHPSCWQRGLWVDDFKRAGYEVIRGLEQPGAPTALHSLQSVFSRFDCVTTNGHGSHLAYASYFGARVSIYGPIAEYQERHFANILAHKRNPGIRRRALEECSEAGMRRNHPDFFTAPKDARQRIEWAAREVGDDCRVSPDEMRKLFHWTRADLVRHRVARRARSLASSIVDRLPSRLRHAVQRRSDPRRAEVAETERLRGLPAFVPGETNLMGLPFSFIDPKSFLFTHGELITRQIYRFVTDVPEPRIVDCGANIGLSVLYFKSLHPDCRIVAVEPDPGAFAALSKNVETLGLEGVTLRNAAVWTEPGTISFRRQGGDSGRMARPGESGGMVEVPMVPLRELLREPVQMLKIDIEGAEIDVLESCAEELKRVEHLFVEYHSFADQPQRLDRLFAVLTRAGFRLHIDAHAPSPHPLLFLNIRTDSDPCDMSLNVFGFRPK